MQKEETFRLEDHLEELRKRIFISLLAILVFTVVGFFASDFLIALLKAPARKNLQHLFFFTPYEAFGAKLKLALTSGVVLSLPIVLHQLWRFVAPGLYTRERKVIVPVLAGGSLLFFVGVLFAYFLVIPFALRFFLEFETEALVPLISIDSYLSFFLSFVLIFGFIFDLPLVLIALVALGLVKTAFLACQRRWVLVLAFVVAAILTPTVDILTQSVVAGILWLLFEVSIWIGRRIERKGSPPRM